MGGEKEEPMNNPSLADGVFFPHTKIFKIPFHRRTFTIYLFSRLNEQIVTLVKDDDVIELFIRTQMCCLHVNLHYQLANFHPQM